MNRNFARPNLRPADLLTTNPVIAATGREGMVEALTQVYRVSGADFIDDGSPIAGVANRIDLDEVTLHYCRYDMAATVRFPPMEGFRQFFGLSGGGRIATVGGGIETGFEKTGIIAPDTRFEAAYSAGYSHLVVQFNEGALLDKLELLEGERPAALNLPVFETTAVDQVWRLRDTAMCLAGQFDAGHAPNRLMVAELQQALVTAFLLDNRATGPKPRQDRTRTAGLKELRRLEDYIHAHWDEALSVADVAEACGTSVRSVFARFKEHCGCSPLSYMRDIRLVRARNLLLDPEQGLSVMDVAIRCGFASFGHFAQRYRERFGELPSETLGVRRQTVS